LLKQTLTKLYYNNLLQIVNLDDLVISSIFSKNNEEFSPASAADSGENPFIPLNKKRFLPALNLQG